jgi:hypothetical protein
MRKERTIQVTVLCHCEPDKLVQTYAGFSVVQDEDLLELARFYEGDPVLDYETAMAYAESISARVTHSRELDKLWQKLGSRPKGVKRHA